MGQPRKYGVIKDMTTAARFINDLNTAGDSSVGIASEYLDEESEAAAWAELIASGQVNETVTDEAMKFLFQSITVGAGSDAVQSSQALRITNNDPNHVLLYVQPYDTSLSIPVTRIYVKQEHEIGGVSVTQLGNINSNGWAPAVAYEITSTKEGDILCKLAWCSVDCPTEERSLKKIFACLSIHCYVAKLEGTGTSRTCTLAHGGVNHSAAIFGAKAPCGGFLLHKMSNPDKANGRYGLTIFSIDGTPLYSWCGNGGAPTVMQDGMPVYVNMGGAYGGIGRHIVEASSFEDPPIKVGVLGPIFCTSVGDVAAKARWMQQGPHDYSYFDNTGHISMSKGRNAEAVYLADHGVFLYDGTVDEYTTDNKSLPSNKPQNAAVIVKPIVPDPVPYPEEFGGYYDPIGLSSSGWASAGENDDDILFFGGVEVRKDDINGENYARFVISADSFSYGLADAVVDIPSRDDQSGEYMETALIIVGRTSASTGSNGFELAASGGLFSTEHTAFTSGAGYSMMYNAGPTINNQLFAYGSGLQTGNDYQRRYEASNGIGDVPPINDGTMRYISVLRMKWMPSSEPQITGCIFYDTLSNNENVSVVIDPYRHSRLAQLPTGTRHWNCMLALGCMVDHTGSGNAVYKNMRTQFQFGSYELVHAEGYGYSDRHLDMTNDIYWVGYKNKSSNSSLMSQLTYLKNRFFVTTRDVNLPTIPNL